MKPYDTRSCAAEVQRAMNDPRREMKTEYARRGRHAPVAIIPIPAAAGSPPRKSGRDITYIFS